MSATLFDIGYYSLLRCPGQDFVLKDFPDVPDSQCANYDTDESDVEIECTLDILPKWLTERQDMIFAHKYVKKKEMLGHGQYGTVHKGTFNYGNAM